MKTFFLNVRTYLAEFGWKLFDAGAWFYDHGFGGVATYFYDAVEYIGYVCAVLYDIALTMDNWENYLADHANSILLLWDQINGWITTQIDQAVADASTALTQAGEALQKANNVFTYAYGWLTDRANEAWDRAGNVWGTVTTAINNLAQAAWDRANWVYSQITPIAQSIMGQVYDWVRSVPQEIRDYVTSAIGDITTLVQDTVNSAIDNFAASIAGPINLINAFFDDIQNFFSDPTDWILTRIEQALDRLSNRLWNIIETILEFVW